MELESAAVESVTVSDILGLATWDRPRTSEELMGFIARREAQISQLNEET